ncbi:glutathione synthase [Sinimarinibacterium sp. CAU 1509]|uniref:glutathione synthase n=1 Tax=Sinimarinibacterium sp. CAU 1509 TaxID=2562283 RepID=UPI0010AB7F2C|nr:glutathione synthase [Sinimarinibacterium sp. CAU 1509]TJY62000.1 glutathione synthase [Sinimarinibacterium sp. CAU 1509]
MNRTLGVVMDPIRSIKPYKDTTLALMLAAQKRGWQLRYLEMQDLWLRDGIAMGRSREIEVFDDPQRWFEFGDSHSEPLGQLDAILMRKDPPFDLEFVAATYVLQRAQDQGALVVNRPQSLRDANEKVFISWFPQCCAPTLIARDSVTLRAFHAEHHDVIFKPLDGMGGAGIFRITSDGMNLGAVIEALTDNGRQHIMAQRYIPQIVEGDKRILMVDGEPVPYALARIPQAGEVRGNLAAGGRGEPRPLSERDRWIAAQVGPSLRELGLIFVGLDVIGDYLTEINVTSPTCARELDAACKLDIGGDLIRAIEARLR